MRSFPHTFLLPIVFRTVFVQSNPVTDSCATFKSSFEDDCGIVAGIIVGGQCFFRVEEKDDWPTAWTKCSTKAAAVGRTATLAQIHTTNEFNKITAYMGPYARAVWSGLKRSESYSYTGNCGDSFRLGETWWYDSADSSNSNLLIDKTWMWTAAATSRFDLDNPENETTNHCFCIFAQKSSADDTSLPYNSMGNIPCSLKTYSLCQFSSECQQFKLVVNNCYAGPIYSSSTAADTKDCATKCATTGPCRGFNYHSNGLCELTTWVHETGYPSAFSFTNFPSCTYNRQPKAPPFTNDPNCFFYESTDMTSCT